MAESSGTISADRLRSLTGLTDRRHRQLADQGYFPQPVRGEYQAGPTIRGLFRYFQEQLHKKNDTGRLAEERLKSAKADIAEDERDRGRELYVLKSEIGPALRNVSVHQRAILQRKMEQELPAKCAHKKAIEILGFNRAAVDEICGIFSESISRWVSESVPEAFSAAALVPAAGSEAVKGVPKKKKNQKDAKAKEDPAEDDHDV